MDKPPFFIGLPERIRTVDLQSRSLTRYPAVPRVDFQITDNSITHKVEKFKSFVKNIGRILHLLSTLIKDARAFTRASIFCRLKQVNYDYRNKRYQKHNRRDKRGAVRGYILELANKTLKVEGGD